MKPIIRIGPMTGTIWMSTRYTEKNGIVTMQTKEDITSEFIACMKQIEDADFPFEYTEHPEEDAS